MSFLALSLLLSASPLSVDLIFPPQEKHVHGSSVVELPNGDLLATWFYGSGERTADDVIIQGSRLRTGAAEWEPVFTLADTPDHADCNPILFLDAQDRLWLFWIAVRAQKWEQSLLKYRRTSNYNEPGAPVWEWQDAILLKPGEMFAERMRTGIKELAVPEDLWADYARSYTQQLLEAIEDPVKRDIGWMTRTSAMTLPSGRMLLPLYSDGFNVSLVAYSDDGGERWVCGEPIVGFGNIQPTLARKKDGTLVAYMRDNGLPPKRILQGESKDDGATWSVARDTELKNPGASVAVAQTPSGWWVMAFNDQVNGRNNLSLAVSKDEGNSWETLGAFAAGPKETSFHYPFLAAGRDGALHLSFTYNTRPGKTIAHARFDESFLAPGLPATAEHPLLRP